MQRFCTASLETRSDLNCHQLFLSCSFFLQLTIKNFRCLIIKLPEFRRHPSNNTHTQLPNFLLSSFLIPNDQPHRKKSTSRLMICKTATSCSISEHKSENLEIAIRSARRCLFIAAELAAIGYFCFVLAASVSRGANGGIT